MSVKALTWAFSQTLKPTEKVVLLALADTANEDHQSWPSLRTLAAKASVSRRTCQRTLDALTKSGLLQAAPQYRKDGSQTSTKYTLQISKKGSAKITPSPVEAGTGGMPHDGMGGAPIVSPLEPLLEPSLDTSSLRSEAPQASSKEESPPEPSLPPIPDCLDRNKPVDPARRVFDLGVDILARYGKSNSQARGIVGKWRKERSDTDLIAILAEADAKVRSDMVAYVEGVLRGTKSAPPRENELAKLQREGVL